MSNPLLAMLQQAANGPPTPNPAPAPAANPAPREQATSPTGYLKQVSIEDLFKNMNMTPPVKSPSHDKPAVHGMTSPKADHAPFPAPGFPPIGGVGSPVAPPTGLTSPPAHQAKLLGMLSLGKPQDNAGSREASGQQSAASGPSPVSREEERRSSLLNVLRSPGSAHVPLAEPMHHISSAITPPGLVSPALGPSSATSPRPSHGPIGPASPPPSAPKSMFDFVSPFDAFDRPQSRAPNGSGTPAGGNDHVAPEIPTPTTAVSCPAPPAQPTPPTLPAAASPAAEEPPASASASASPVPPALSPPGAYHMLPAPSTVRQSSSVRGARKPATPPQPKGKTDLGLPYLSSKLVKDEEGNGPMTLSPGPIVVDLSKPNTDSLVNAPGSVQITPTTIMKAESVAFQRGRTIGATKGWLAYILARGRIRLIDRASGARTVIQLEATGPIIDMAVSAETLAVVASDGSVLVFGIPATWSRDDPPCPLLFNMRPIDADLVPAESTVGDINRLEFVNRQNSAKPSLAIGGTEGVVIVHPYDWHASPEADPREVLTSSKVLKTSGVLAAFCLNATHQAIGLLSSSGYFTLYSVVNLNRVWNRQLPSSTQLPLSSVCFCETNILVGRANNTHFDLVQITVEIAVLATIKFVAGPPSPPALHFAQATYSADRETLVITPFARGSAFAFHYALKGQPPQRSVMKDNAHVQAFDSMAEYPLDGPVLSFVLGGMDGDLELFYSTPSGINQAHIDKSVLTAGGPNETRVPEVPKSKQEPKQEQKQEPKQEPKPEPKQERRTRKQNKQAASSPVAPRELDDASSAVASPVRSATPVVAPAPTSVAGGITPDELAKALKKTEDKMTASFKQIVANEMKSVSARLDKDKDLAASVSSVISSHLDTHLAGIVQQELKRVPIEAQIRQAVSEQSATLGRELERAIAPIVPRTIATVVQPAVERAARDAVEVVLVPAVMSATNRMYDQLADDLKTEMLQIRKDVDKDQGDALSATNAMLRNMTNSISELQKQVADLSAQLQSQATASPPPVRSPPQSMQPRLSSPPPSLARPSPGKLEDTFLNVLHQGSSPAMLQLISQQSSHLDTILPVPPATSPLPQAVILPLIHRLSLALNDLPPHHPAFQLAATWLRRAVDLVDPHDSTIASYYPRAMPLVEHGLAALVERMQSQGMAHDPLVAAHIGVLRQTIDVIKAKA